MGGDHVDDLLPAIVPPWVSSLYQELTMHAVKISALFVLGFMVAGCSTEPRPGGILPPIGEVAVVNQHSADVLVLVTGGDFFLATLSRRMQTALMQILDNTKVFSSAQPYGVAKYELIVVIRTKEHYSFFRVEVNISSDWILRTRDGTEIWSATVKGSGISDAFFAESRHRAAQERGAKESIIKGVEALSQL